jgi:hypothetical protein
VPKVQEPNHQPQPQKVARKPKLVNRGPSGLLSKVTGTLAGPEVKQSERPKVRNKISPNLRALGMVTPITNLTPDPNNVRLHPERNIEAIKDSLCWYGQVKPLVVRKSDNVVLAGNGTLEAAKALGWTEIAVSWEDMDRVHSTGYAIADNRTAELARWDLETLAVQDKLLQEFKHPLIGYSSDEMKVLRMADWSPPPPSGEVFGSKPQPVKLTVAEREVFERAVNVVRDQRMEDGDLSEGDCLRIICLAYLGEEDDAQSTGSLGDTGGEAEEGTDPGEWDSRKPRF